MNERSLLTEADREYARRLARQHHAACVAAGCQAEHERVLGAIARAHRAEERQ
jgi:hypothetical protein